MVFTVFSSLIDSDVEVGYFKKSCTTCITPFKVTPENTQNTIIQIVHRKGECLAFPALLIAAIAVSFQNVSHCDCTSLNTPLLPEFILSDVYFSCELEANDECLVNQSTELVFTDF